MNILYRDARFLKIDVIDTREKILFFQEHIFDNIYYTEHGRYAFKYTNMSVEDKSSEYDASLYLLYDCSIDDVKRLFSKHPAVFRVPVLNAKGKLVGEYYDASSEGISLYQQIENRCYELLKLDYFRQLFTKWSTEHQVACIGRNDRTAIITSMVNCSLEEDADIVIDTDICGQYHKYLNDNNNRVPISEIFLPLLLVNVVSFFKEKGVNFFAAYGIKKSDLKDLTSDESAFIHKSIEEAVFDDDHVRVVAGQDEKSLQFIRNHTKDLNRISKIVFNGIHNQQLDMNDEHFNIIDGKRVTIGQPSGNCQEVHLFGPCVVQGLCVSDAQTIPSILQSQIIEHKHANVRVHNHGMSYGKDLLNDLLMMMSMEFSKGDIIIWMCGFSNSEKKLIEKIDVPVIDCTTCIVEYHDWFYNIPFHCNAFANKIFANTIYRSISCCFGLKRTDQCESVSMNKANDMGLTYDENSLLSSIQLEQYIDKLKKYKPYSQDFTNIGSIVVHANPCTLGHLYLINHALNLVDFIYVFLIQYTGKGSFDYIDREKMLIDSLERNPRICIVPSGNVFATPLSFPEYFNRSEATRINPMLDNMIFALRVAPALGIKYRFFGSEPNDTITQAFVRECQRYLPTHGINVKVIERIELNGEPISAKKARLAWQQKNYKDLARYVPRPAYLRLLELNNDNTEQNLSIK